jgi:hypothetical protein
LLPGLRHLARVNPKRHTPGLRSFENRFVNRIVERAAIQIGRKGDAEEPELLHRAIELVIAASPPNGSPAAAGMKRPGAMREASAM